MVREVRAAREARGRLSVTTPEGTRAGRIERPALVLLVLAALVASGLAPHDRLTWALEVSWVAVGLPAVVALWKRFPLTPLLCRLLSLHALVLALGGHYTYERVPPGLWVQELLDLQRNHYDRLGHFVQGFVPAILAREVLVRLSPLRSGRWLFFLVASVCLGFSAFFELIEWMAAAALGQAADAYLATQGDVWDTQWDMALALAGVLTAQALLCSRHDRELARLPSR